MLLKRKQAEQALPYLELENSNIIIFPKQAIIYAHALAESANTDQAKAVLKQVPQQSAEIIDFCALLERRYFQSNLSQHEQDVLDEQVAEREFAFVLRAA